MAESSEKIKVLVVDDMAFARQLVIKSLKKFNATFLEAANGRLALELLKAHPDVSLIISDSNMPVLNGIEMVKILRSSEFKQVPILIVSADHSLKLGEEYRALGVADFLLKPWGSADLQKAYSAIVDNLKLAV